MEKPDRLNILNVGGGVAPELFSHELSRVVSNMADVNTDPEGTRSITLKFTLKPYPDRSGAICTVEAKAALAPVKKHESSIFLGRDEGEMQAYPRDTRQQALFTTPDSPQNVVSMNGTDE